MVHALEGHPEVPRLWEQHIHHILTNKLRFHPTTHEKCLYWRRDHNGFQMLLRQVDDFAVSAIAKEISAHTIEAIGSHLQVPLNDLLDVIKKFNSVNIQQTNRYVKLTCEDYLQRLLSTHQWLDLPAANLPIPMRSDSQFLCKLETTARPQTPEEQRRIQEQAGFSYQQAIGKLIYAMIVARPDLSFAITKLSQYSNNPALIHYKALKHIYAYVNKTKDDGLIY